MTTRNQISYFTNIILCIWIDSTSKCPHHGMSQTYKPGSVHHVNQTTKTMHRSIATSVNNLYVVKHIKTWINNAHKNLATLFNSHNAIYPQNASKLLSRVQMR